LVTLLLLLQILMLLLCCEQRVDITQAPANQAVRNNQQQQFAASKAIKPRHASCMQCRGS
jgi:hypothetical protein